MGADPKHADFWGVSGIIHSSSWPLPFMTCGTWRVYLKLLQSRMPCIFSGPVSGTSGGAERWTFYEGKDFLLGPGAMRYSVSKEQRDQDSRESCVALPP